MRPEGFRLVLAGDADFQDDYVRHLKAQAKEADVVLTGFVKGRKLTSLLTHARAYALPSSHEGLPIALLEAMSYGLPIAASDIPANREVQLPPEAYFPTGDIDALSQRLNTLLAQPPTRLTYDMRKYDWDRIARQVEEVYLGVKSEKRKVKSEKRGVKSAPAA